VGPLQRRIELSTTWKGRGSDLVVGVTAEPYSRAVNTRTYSAPPDVRRDRAVGAVLASAAGDALGAPHEFRPALASETELLMSGGGTLEWAPGEWTDDTQTALAILRPLSTGQGGQDLLAAIESGLLSWQDSQPRDVGIQTRAVLTAALGSGEPLTDVTAAWQARHPDSAGNGSLMRTGPVALAQLDRRDRAELAAKVSALTHANDDAVEACVLWTSAMSRAIDARPSPRGDVDWVDLVAAGLDLVPEAHRDLWRGRLEKCRSAQPEEFTPNGWVVSALQAALSTLAQTRTPGTQPCRHLRLAIERAVRIGDDADTVAAITGSLAGAWWGATAVPLEWRRTLHGRIDYRADPVRAADLEHLARLAFGEGETDPSGWPAADSLIPHYQRHWPAEPLVADLDEWVSIGNVHALAGRLAQVDVVVSLCRMGQADVPRTVEHHVIGLLGSDADDNPNLGFVLADTADFLARCADEQRRVFVHCVQAENRTIAVAAAHLVRNHALDPELAFDRVARLTNSRPKPFLADAVRELADAEA
jgi:ADP-ribosyl-[dinitrogen reductase] hydrolase